ncbi:ABC transporter permease [Bosea caraganae]|uniref:ABC transporter permease n=1 Tax=Bosea caraganae TaxID=2763117 RepID=A0A370L9Z0_9HYPH|nr:ABC transporter permease [Bosea caraganae]RDJ21846.1 ABC transporter permease [Bosea caraganae]RDJ28123.1 ABC transporter permease [Bosea caraganae]
MARYIFKRLLATIPFIFLVSLTVFVLIQLPPGDFVTSYAAKASANGETIDPATLDSMRVRYGLDQPMLTQYFTWISGIILHGDFGYSFEWQAPVSSLIGERMLLTLVLSLLTLAFTWCIALPIGIYSAVKKYSLGDYVFTLIGFIGLAVPNFLFGLILMYLAVVYFGQDVTGLFSPEFANAPWSWARVADLMQHLWIPIIILGTSSAASLIRIMRANLIDQLYQPYVVTARAKGLKEVTLLLRYPIRLALNPFISTLGWILPHLVSGAVITSIILNLPTAGPLLYQSLLSQDIYLSGAFLLLLCLMTVIGTLLSDILLVLVDPRIRFD